MSSVKNETLKGVKWTAINSFSQRGFQFLLGIVLARLLTPTDYGTVGMAGIFFAIAEIIIDSGLGAALIQRKDLTKEDTSTVFFFNIAASIVCCTIICVFSGNIARFLNAPILEDMVKVSAISMVIGSLGSVHWSLMTKDVNFKTPTLVRLPVSVVTGCLGILLAYLGYGPWALIWSSFASTCISTVVVWIISPWRPAFVFSTKSFKSFFSFSGNIAINSIFDKFFNEGVGMLIGKYYTPTQLGFYSKGQGTAQLPSTFLYNMVGSVTFPVLSKIQDDEQQLMNVYSRFMRTLSLVIFFGMFLLIAIARPLVVFLYTDKWLPAVIFMQLFCLKFMFYHVHAINWNFLLVKGRTDWAFKKELINKTIKLIFMLIGISYGPIYLCVALIASSIWDIFVNTFVTGKLFSYGLRKQASDFIPYFILSAVCCAPAFAISFLHLMPLLSLIIEVMLSCTLYFGFLYLKRDTDFIELVKITPLKKIIKI